MATQQQQRHRTYDGWHASPFATSEQNVHCVLQQQTFFCFFFVFTNYVVAMRLAVVVAAACSFYTAKLCDAASYQALDKKIFITNDATVFTARQHTSRPIVRSLECTRKYKNCTACAADDACAWCKNLNRCVQELHTLLTCATNTNEDVADARNHNFGGVFGPEDLFDHVGKYAPNPQAKCNEIFDPVEGLFRVHPDQAQVLSCDYVRAQQKKNNNDNNNDDEDDDDAPLEQHCCGDGLCGDAETRANCPVDCKEKVCFRAEFALNTRPACTPSHQRNEQSVAAVHFATCCALLHPSRWACTLLMARTAAKRGCSGTAFDAWRILNTTAMQCTSSRCKLSLSVARGCQRCQRTPKRNNALTHLRA